jgi:hypothetical protein
MLDRLMGRSILTKADRIVSHHIDDPNAHERREADRGPAIVGEAEERAAIGDDAAMEREPAHRGGHCMLAHAIVDISPTIVAGGERL